MVVKVTVGEAEIGGLVAGGGGEGGTDGVGMAGIETLVDVGLSAAIDSDGWVAKEIGEGVGPKAASLHPTSKNMATTNVTGCSNLFTFIEFAFLTRKKLSRPVLIRNIFPR